MHATPLASEISPTSNVTGSSALAGGAFGFSAPVGSAAFFAAASTFLSAPSPFPGAAEPFHLAAHDSTGLADGCAVSSGRAATPRIAKRIAMFLAWARDARFGRGAC